MFRSCFFIYTFLCCPFWDLKNKNKLHSNKNDIEAPVRDINRICGHSHFLLRLAVNYPPEPTRGGFPMECLLLVSWKEILASERTQAEFLLHYTYVGDRERVPKGIKKFPITLLILTRDHLLMECNRFIWMFNFLVLPEGIDLFDKYYLFMVIITFTIYLPYL